MADEREVTDTSPVRLTAVVRGHVQGVGFRWWASNRAQALGLVGSATNREDRTVQVVAEGPESACQNLLAELRGGRTPGRVRNVTAQWSAARGNLSRFDTH